MWRRHPVALSRRTRRISWRQSSQLDCKPYITVEPCYLLRCYLSYMLSKQIYDFFLISTLYPTLLGSSWICIIVIIFLLWQCHRIFANRCETDMERHRQNNCSSRESKHASPQWSTEANRFLCSLFYVGNPYFNFSAFSLDD